MNRRMLVSLVAVLFSLSAALAHAQAKRAEDSRFVIVSDAATQYSTEGKTWRPAVLAWVHPAWPSLPGAKWIWTGELVTPEEAQNGSGVVIFRRRFAWNGSEGARADIQIAVDNAYELTVNGKPLSRKGPLNRLSNEDALWRVTDRCTCLLRRGENEIVIKAMNYHWPYSGVPSAKDNPGGVLFRLEARAAQPSVWISAPGAKQGQRP